MLILLIVFCAAYIVILIYKQAEQKEKIIDLETRFENLQKETENTLNQMHKVGNTVFMNDSITPDKVLEKQKVKK